VKSSSAKKPGFLVIHNVKEKGVKQVFLNPSENIKKWSGKICMLLDIEESPVVSSLLYAWTECTVLESEMRQMYQEKASIESRGVAESYRAKRQLVEDILQHSNTINQTKLEALKALTEAVFKDKAEEEEKRLLSS